MHSGYGTVPSRFQRLGIACVVQAFKLTCLQQIYDHLSTNLKKKRKKKRKKRAISVNRSLFKNLWRNQSWGNRLWVTSYGVTRHGVTSYGVTSCGLTIQVVTSHEVTSCGVTRQGVTGYGVTRQGVTSLAGCRRRRLAAFITEPTAVSKSPS